jgi:hypothetical protein
METNSKHKNMRDLLEAGMNTEFWWWGVFLEIVYMTDSRDWKIHHVQWQDLVLLVFILRSYFQRAA